MVKSGFVLSTFNSFIPLPFQRSTEMTVASAYESWKVECNLDSNLQFESHSPCPIFTYFNKKNHILTIFSLFRFICFFLLRFNFFEIVDEKWVPKLSAKLQASRYRRSNNYFKYVRTMIPAMFLWFSVKKFSALYEEANILSRKQSRCFLTVIFRKNHTSLPGKTQLRNDYERTLSVLKCSKNHQTEIFLQVSSSHRHKVIFKTQYG